MSCNLLQVCRWAAQGLRGSCEAIGDHCFPSFCSAILEYRPSSRSSPHGYRVVCCPFKPHFHILEKRGEPAKGERGSCQPRLSFKKRPSYLLTQRFLLIAHGPELCPMGQWEDEHFYLGHSSSEQNQGFIGKEKWEMDMG